MINVLMLLKFNVSDRLIKSLIKMSNYKFINGKY